MECPVREAGRQLRQYLQGSHHVDITSEPHPEFRIGVGRPAAHETGGMSPSWFETAPPPAVVARLDRAIQYSREICDELRGRGVLGRPVKPGDDGCL
jgi:hypothetical protein